VVPWADENIKSLKMLVPVQHILGIKRFTLHPLQNMVMHRMHLIQITSILNLINAG
jgi:hypothetical protein